MTEQEGTKQRKVEVSYTESNSKKPTKHEEGNEHETQEVEIEREKKILIESNALQALVSAMTDIHDLVTRKAVELEAQLRLIADKDISPIEREAEAKAFSHSEYGALLRKVKEIADNENLAERFRLIEDTLPANSSDKMKMTYALNELADSKEFDHYKHRGKVGKRCLDAIIKSSAFEQRCRELGLRGDFLSSVKRNSWEMIKMIVNRNSTGG